MVKKHSSHLHIVVRFAVFILLFVLAVGTVSRLLMPKYLYDNAGPVTETYNGFYHMKKNTVDCLVVGTSQAATSFHPQVFYDEAQVRAYNLSSPMQNMRDSYYWVEEALKTQSPRAVLVEAYNLFNDSTGEVPSRNALDYMRNDAVKVRDVKDTVQQNPEWSGLSYFLTNIRYHTRWQELEENDFGYGITESGSTMKGFWNFIHVYGEDDFTPLTETGSETVAGVPLSGSLSRSGSAGSSNPENPGENPDDAAAVMAPDAESYLKRLVSLCRDHHMELILVKAPWNSWTMGNHLAVLDFAKANGLSFYDFNMEGLYRETGFCYAEDIDDSNGYGAHCNAAGAAKLSRFMADELVRRGICVSVPDDQWEETREANENAYRDFVLVNTGKANKWLSLLCDKRYTVIISRRGGNDTEGGQIPENMQKPLEALGLSFDLFTAPGQNYAAVIENGKVLDEESTEGPIDYRGALRNGRVRLEVVSGNDTASIRLDGEETAKGSEGLNVVVYQNDIRKVIDSVSMVPIGSDPDLTR